MFRRTRYQKGSLRREERKRGSAVWVYRWWENETSRESQYVARCSWDVWNDIQTNQRHARQQTLFSEHQLMIRDYLRHSDLHVTNKYFQTTTKSKRLAQGKLVDAILPGGVVSRSEANQA